MRVGKEGGEAKLTLFWIGSAPSHASLVTPSGGIWPVHPSCIKPVSKFFFVWKSGKTATSAPRHAPKKTAAKMANRQLSILCQYHLVSSPTHPPTLPPKCTSVLESGKLEFLLACCLLVNASKLHTPKPFPHPSQIQCPKPGRPRTSFGLLSFACTNYKTAACLISPPPCPPPAPIVDGGKTVSMLPFH